MCACNFFKGDHRYDTAGCRGQGNSEILEFCTGAGMHDESAGLPVSDIGKARQGKGFVLMPPPSMEPLSKISGSQGLSVSAWAPFIHCRGMTRYVSGGPGARHSILQEGSGKAVGEFDRFFGHSTRQGIQTKTKYRSVLVSYKQRIRE